MLINGNSLITTTMIGTYRELFNTSIVAPETETMKLSPNLMLTKHNTHPEIFKRFSKFTSNLLSL